MQIIIPMAGLGKRFYDAGYKLPKPLINVHGKPMIQTVIESLGLDGEYIFIIRDYGNFNYVEQLTNTLRLIKPKSIIVKLDYNTNGAVSTLLTSRKYIDDSDEILQVNCDQIFQWQPNAFLTFLSRQNCDGIVGVYRHFSTAIKPGRSPYSFIRLDEYGYGLELMEKFAISEYPLSGLHYWKRGKDALDSWEELVLSGDHINGEYYVSMSYNKLIQRGKKVLPYFLNKDEHICIGTPEDLQAYENS